MNDKLGQIVCSNARNKNDANKLKIRPVLLKNQLVFQESSFQGTKVFHQNYSREEMRHRLVKAAKEEFRQIQIENALFQATVLVGKKGNITIKKKAALKEGADTACKVVSDTVPEHNRKKNYILQEGTPIDFLVELGVMNQEGKVLSAKYDKFRQINRYLEFIADVVEKLPNDRSVRIIDFGCGKSYLTFAMYYYLKVLSGLQVEIIGLDLKEDVIEKCSKLADKLGYKELHFMKGDISSFTGANEVDMVVTLHACDTATDYAIEKAVKWGAKVILCVPCCQHEVNRQIQSESLKPILKYGIIKERISALVTDAIRANVLEELGYDTQILEFIDMEHTPKNLLIRAVKSNGMCKKRVKSIKQCTNELHVETTLQKLLNDTMM